MFNPLIGVSATDNVDGNVTVTVVENTVNVNVPGTYTVRYRAMDAAGNVGTATKTVIVEQVTPPAEVGWFVTGTGNGMTARLSVGNYGSPADIVVDGYLPANTPWSAVQEVRLSFWKVPSPVWCLHQFSGNFDLGTTDSYTMSVTDDGLGCDESTVATLPNGVQMIEAIPYLVVNNQAIPIDTGVITGYQNGEELDRVDGDGNGIPDSYLLDVSSL